MKIKKTISKQAYLKIIGLVIFAYIVMNIEVNRVISILLKSQLSYLIIALVFMVVHNCIKLFRYQFILIQQGVKNPLAKTVHYSLAASYISFITPGRVGEISKAFFIHNDLGTPLNRLFAGSFLNRIFDVYALLITALFGFVIVLPIENTIAIVITILILLLSPAFFLFKKAHITIVKFVAYVQNKFGNSDSLSVQIDHFISEINALLNLKILIGIIATTIAYAFFFASCYLMSLSIDVPLPYHKIAIYIACANILSFLPVSFAGIGTREACLVYFFSLEGLSSESAIAFSTIIFSLTYILLGLIGFICFMTLENEKKQLRKNA